MNFLVQFVIIALLFVVLTQGAGVVVRNLQAIGKKFGISEISLGILLGLLTTLPEGTIAINSFVNDIPSLSFGNLYGGIIVIFCLVMGVSAILNRGIRTQGRVSRLAGYFILMLLPLFLGLRGELDALDGILLLLGYVYVLFKLTFGDKRKVKNSTPSQQVVTFNKKELLFELLYMLVGLVVIVVSSNFIVRITEDMLVTFSVNAFIVGLLVFSLGTNLPELIIAITAWKKHMRSLSLSNLLGSALANIMIIGFMALARNIPITVNTPYLAMFGFLIVLFSAVFWFFRTDHRLTKKEGIVLISLFGIFAAIEIISQVFE